MKNKFNSFMSLALALAMTAGCSSRETADKLMQGSTVTNTVNTAAPGTPASAVQNAVVAVQMIGVGINTGTLAPRPNGAGAPQLVPSNSTYDAVNGWYALALTCALYTTLAFRMRLLDSGGLALALWGTASPFTALNTALLAQVATAVFILTATDARGNSVIAQLTRAGAFSRFAANVFSGTVTTSGNDGNLTLTTSDLQIDGSVSGTGRPVGGTLSGSGLTPAGQVITALIITFLATGAATGSMKVDGQNVAFDVGADGAGTYVDDSGTHAIE